MHDEVTLQRLYYADTAASYDQRHVNGIDEHVIALGWLSGLLKIYQFDSLLDVGSGTGRCLRFLREQGHSLKMTGVEPVAELREIARKNGLTDADLIDGDALALPFGDRAVDIVCAFGILHHIRDHRRAVSEMCRVARRAVFISDCNNLGQGSPFMRAAKQLLHSTHLWRAYDFVRTKGRMYQYSEGDGIFYSYTLFDDEPVLRTRFAELRFVSSTPSGANLFRTASHVAVFAQEASPAGDAITRCP